MEVLRAEEFFCHVQGGYHGCPLTGFPALWCHAEAAHADIMTRGLGCGGRLIGPPDGDEAQAGARETVGRKALLAGDGGSAISKLGGLIQ